MSFLFEGLNGEVIMKTVTLKICATYEAERDRKILEDQGVKAVVVPHYKSPQVYVGESMTSEILVREDQLEEAKQLLGIS